MIETSIGPLQNPQGESCSQSNPCLGIDAEARNALRTAARLGLTIELTTPVDGGGPWWELAWEPVDEADGYSVTVYSPQGRAYWAWNGAETSVVVGGFDEPPPSDASVEPRLEPGMTWDVVAYDAEEAMIAQSGVRPIGP